MVTVRTDHSVSEIIASGQKKFLVEYFTNGTSTKDITIDDHATLTYLIVCTDTAAVTINCHLRAHSRATIYALCVGTPSSTLSLTLHSHLEADHAVADMHIVTFLRSHSTCTIDGGVEIHKHVQKVEGYLLEENIILDDDVRIHTIPRLNVASNDVKASHGARIEKLDEKKLFYLMSKGIAKRDAKKLMIA